MILGGELGELSFSPVVTLHRTLVTISILAESYLRNNHPIPFIPFSPPLRLAAVAAGPNAVEQLCQAWSRQLNTAASVSGGDGISKDQCC